MVLKQVVVANGCDQCSEIQMVDNLRQRVEIQGVNAFQLIQGQTITVWGKTHSDIVNRLEDLPDSRRSNPSSNNSPQTTRSPMRQPGIDMNSVKFGPKPRGVLRRSSNWCKAGGLPLPLQLHPFCQAEARISSSQFQSAGVTTPAINSAIF